MSLEELGNMPKTRRDFLKFLGLATGTAVGSVLFKEFFSSEPAEAKKQPTVCGKVLEKIETYVADGKVTTCVIRYCSKSGKVVSRDCTISGGGS